MGVAIITENFLPKLDGVTRTLARLLEHVQTNGDQALLLGPNSGMTEYAGAEIIGTAGLPFPFYPELKFNFFRPLFLRRLSEFQPDVVHMVDPVILGATGLAAARFLKMRKQMGQAGLVQPHKYSWYEAMECLMDGYREAIMNAQTLIAA